MRSIADAPDSTGYPNSYYAATANPIRHPRRPPLCGEHDADVCVVGAGYTGLSAALHLAERGYRVILLDAERAGWGASGRNGGQLGSGQRKDQNELETLLGIDRARQLWALAEEAKRLATGLIAKHAIDCALKPGLAYAAHRRSRLDPLHRYADKLNRDYGYAPLRAVGRAELADALGCDVYHGGVIDDGGYHLHPLNYALGLADAAVAAGVGLYEQSRVRGFRGGDVVRVATARGVVRARWLLLACNGYLGRFAPALAGRVMPINNFILATEALDAADGVLPADLAVADSRFVVNYFRLSAERRLLFGGGENYTRRFPADIAGFVRRYMLQIYPRLAGKRIDYAWGGTLAVTLNRLPDFGRLAPNVLFAHGYSGHGVALATLAGALLAETAAGTAERFDVMASVPTSRFPGGRYLRWPALALGMSYYALRDRL